VAVAGRSQRGQHGQQPRLAWHQRLPIDPAPAQACAHCHTEERSGGGGDEEEHGQTAEPHHALQATDSAVQAWGYSGYPSIASGSTDDQNAAVAGSTTAPLPTVAGTGGAALEFVSLLKQLNVARHAGAFATESILSPDDLRNLTDGNLQALGLKIGERNRVIQWAARRAAAAAAVEQSSGVEPPPTPPPKKSKWTVPEEQALRENGITWYKSQVKFRERSVASIRSKHQRAVKDGWTN
jgi:hypothetical protein